MGKTPLGCSAPSGEIELENPQGDGSPGRSHHAESMELGGGTEVE
jgi:hypothetical protein